MFYCFTLHATSVKHLQNIRKNVLVVVEHMLNVGGGYM